MKEIFESYIKKFPYDEKDFYFDWFLRIDKTLNYVKFEEMVLWVKDNPIDVAEILENNKELIFTINENYRKQLDEAIKNRKYALPTYYNVSTYIGMFDES